MKKEETFEELLERLESITSKLEKEENISLDESMKLFEEGAKLTGFCQKALQSAEQKIVKLTSAESGEGDTLSVPEDTMQSMGEALSD